MHGNPAVEALSECMRQHGHRRASDGAQSILHHGHGALRSSSGAYAASLENPRTENDRVWSHSGASCSARAIHGQVDADYGNTAVQQYSSEAVQQYGCWCQAAAAAAVAQLTSSSAYAPCLTSLDNSIFKLVGMMRRRSVPISSGDLTNAHNAKWARCMVMARAPLPIWEHKECQLIHCTMSHRHRCMRRVEHQARVLAHTPTAMYFTNVCQLSILHAVGQQTLLTHAYVGW